MFGHRSRSGWWGTQVLKILLIGVGGLLPFLPQPVVAEMSPDPVRLVYSTSEAVAIEFAISSYVLRKVSAQDQTFVQVEVPGLRSNAEPGTPRLPQSDVLIGLPLTGTPVVRVLEVEQERVPVGQPVYPAPSPVRVRAKAGELPAGPAYEFFLDETVYSRDAFYPADVVNVVELGWLRDRRFARVAFHPLRFNPVRGELEVTRRLVAEIRFERSSDTSAAEASGAPFQVFEAVLQDVLLNFETARGWRADWPKLATIDTLNPPATQEGSYKIIVDADGLYRLTYVDLQAAGLPVDDLDPRTFRLFEGGQEVAIQLEGQDDGSFDPSDSLLFYGREPHSRYTDRNVYWLGYGDTVGLRMETRDALTGTLPVGAVWAMARYEENRFYDPTLPAADGDHWYAADMRPGADQTAVLTLMPLAAGVPTATLRVRMVGYTVSQAYDPDHHATFLLNGTEVGELEWNGVSPVTATLVLDGAVLQSGDNLVTARAGVPFEGIWLDSIALEYPFQAITGDETIFFGQDGVHRYEVGGFTTDDVSLYDVTDPQAPVLLQDAEVTIAGTLAFTDASVAPATYLVSAGEQVRRPISVLADTPSSLYDDAAGVDYLIITHGDFADAVQPLAAHRQAQGLAVAVADVQDVYDEYNGGLLAPEAIRDFVAHVMPLYVLLVGDGSYDFLDHYGYGSVNYIPPYLAMVDRWWGETAADNRYAAVIGDDPLPDVLLGRLPVTTATEAAVVVQKILDYEQAPWLGDWNARHVFVAAADDPAGDFDSLADVVYNQFIVDPWIGQKIYVDALSAETARQETLAGWQRGALLTSFMGHSSWHEWAAYIYPSVESLLNIHDVPGLRNGGQMPVLLSMTCFTGFFHHPEYGTLDESLLRLDGGGAVATWSPSGLGVAAEHDVLHQGFYEAVFADGLVQLGPAILAAKSDLYSLAPLHADLVDTFHLFGDPAMALNLTIRPWPYSIFLPLVLDHSD